MTPNDIKFHAALIRYLRGMLNSWEEWIYKVKEEADPREHIEEMNSQTRRNAAPRQ